MIRLALTALGASLLMAQAPAPAPGGREAVRLVCDPEVQRLCPEAAGNPFRIRACLTADPARLAPACRAALQSAGILPP
jgi:hypothetical protein